jgi:hypothetical protein
MEFGYRFSKIINNYHKTSILLIFSADNGDLPAGRQVFAEDQQLICADQRNQRENSLG